MLTAGKRAFKMVEFNTHVLESESIINSTPLWKTLSSANEPRPLCPHDLLLSKEPYPKDQCAAKVDLEAYRSRQWHQVQFLADVFWDKWTIYKDSKPGQNGKRLLKH